MYEYKAVALRIIDGDTLEAQLDLGFHTYRREKLRLLGIDTPELHSTDPEERKRAVEAKTLLGVLVMSVKELVIRTHKDKQEKYGRYLCDLYASQADGTQLHVNAALVESGLAKEV